MSQDFFQSVFKIVTLIPPGRVTTYGSIAKCLDSPKSSRMVGWAMNKSHKLNINIPAHRVVNRIGLLTGKNNFESPKQMQELLEAEGIKIENNQVVNFDILLWDCFTEISKLF